MNALTISRRHSGLTLVELMVALTIALLLLVGTASLFVSNKRIYREQDDLSRMQENARFAMGMLVHDIRMSGYAGCSDSIANVDDRLTGGTTATNLISFLNRMEGFEAGESSWNPGSSTDQVSSIVADTDGITVRLLEPMNYSLSSDMASTTDSVKVSSAAEVAAGDQLAVSDCAATDIIEVTGVTSAAGVKSIAHLTGVTTGSSTGNALSSLSRVYTTEGGIARFVARRYFVGTGTNGPALFMKENYNAAQEVIEGVENMQILYGENTDADPNNTADTYSDASSVANWDNVVSVRIALLFRTVAENRNNDVDGNTYDLLGTSYGPFNDRRRRRVFSTTIQVRNNI